jgi:hypothetical protein
MPGSQVPPKQKPEQHIWFATHGAPSRKQLDPMHRPFVHWSPQHCGPTVQAAPSGRHTPASTMNPVQMPARQKPEQQLWPVAHIAPCGKQLVAVVQTPWSHCPPQHCEPNVQRVPSGPHTLASGASAQTPRKQPPMQQSKLVLHDPPNGWHIVEPLHTPATQPPVQHCESTMHAPPSGLHIVPVAQTPPTQLPEQHSPPLLHCAPAGMQLDSVHVPPTQKPSQQTSFARQGPPTGMQASGVTQTPS